MKQNIVLPPHLPLIWVYENLGHNIATWRTALLEEIICNISHINCQEIISIFCPVLGNWDLKLLNSKALMKAELDMN